MSTTLRGVEELIGITGDKNAGRRRVGATVTTLLQ